MAHVPAVTLQWEVANNKKKLFKIEADITSEHVWGLAILMISLLPCCRKRRTRQEVQTTPKHIWMAKGGSVFHKTEKCQGLNAADHKQVREIRACRFCF